MDTKSNHFSATCEEANDIPGFDDLPAPLPRKPMHPTPDFLLNHHDTPVKPARGLRILPHDIHAEQAVLGGIMLAPDKVDLVKGQLEFSDFYQHNHQFIYQAICKLAECGQPIDAVTLGDWFISHGKENLVGGGEYLIELSMTTPSAANIKAYADIVRDKSIQRQLLRAAQEIIDGVYERDGKEGAELLTDANAKIAQLCKESMRGGELKLIQNSLTGLFKELEKRQNGTIGGIVPQWESVKSIIPKLEEKELMILAARPGMGKSANALQWALHAAENQQACAIFSMEMGTNQLLMRALSTLSNVPLHYMRRERGLNNEDWSKITMALRKIQKMPLAIDESPRLTVEKIRARAVHFHSQCKEGLKLIIIDYLQMITGGDKKGSNRNEELTHISRELKNLAKELGCPIIALSQLNRNVESRTDKAPTLADLRDSGAIEQDADIITFLYRPAYYAKDNLPNGQTEENHAQDNVNNACSFHIAKNRSGAIGYATLRAELQYCRFQDGTGLSVAMAEQNLGLHQQKNNTWKKVA